MPGLGVRALRYSMLVDNGKITVLNVEEPGAAFKLYVLCILSYGSPC
jgi:peroxiredoxin